MSDEINTSSIATQLVLEMSTSIRSLAERVYSLERALEKRGDESQAEWPGSRKNLQQLASARTLIAQKIASVVARRRAVFKTWLLAQGDIRATPQDDLIRFYRSTKRKIGTPHALELIKARVSELG